MGMIRFRSPSLPLPTKEYNEGQQDQFQRALKLYFSQLDSNTPVQAEYFRGRGDQLTQPYAMLMSNQDQANAGVTVENLLSFDSIAFSNGISVNGPNNTRIQPTYPGQYLVTFTLQVTNRGNTAAEFEVWAKDGGVNYPMSNTRFDVPQRKSASVWSHVVPAITGIFTVTDPATEYLEIAWWSDSTNVFLEHYPTRTAPTRPEIPSVILTINLVSALT